MKALKAQTIKRLIKVYVLLPMVASGLIIVVSLTL
jgi:hypothetical protein